MRFFDYVVDPDSLETPDEARAYLLYLQAEKERLLERLVQIREAMDTISQRWRVPIAAIEKKIKMLNWDEDDLKPGGTI